MNHEPCPHHRQPGKNLSVHTTQHTKQHKFPNFQVPTRFHNKQDHPNIPSQSTHVSSSHFVSHIQCRRPTVFPVSMNMNANPTRAKNKTKNKQVAPFQAKRQRWKTQNKKLDNDKTDIVK
jgi:hypothetical protein